MGHLLITREIHVVGGAILRDARCLVARRSGTMPEAGRWEFPGGKVEPGETPVAALVRELREELGCEVRPIDILGRGRAAQPDGRRILLDVYEAELVSGVPRAREHAELRWADPTELTRLAWARADVAVVHVVVERLGRGRQPGARSPSGDG